MWKQPENDQFVDELFLAGERVPSGVYRQIGCGREVHLDEEDFLPASFSSARGLLSMANVCQGDSTLA